MNPYNCSSVILGPILQMRKQADLKDVRASGDSRLQCSILGNNGAVGIECHRRLHNADLKQRQVPARNFLLRCLSVLRAVLKEA